MAAPIGPGDWVECVASIRHGAPGSAGGDRFKRGGLYLVEGVVDGHCHCGKPHGGLVIAGKRSGHQSGAYASCAFRPIYRPKQTFIDSLKQPAPERECEAV